MLQRVNFNPLRPRGRRLLIFHMAVAVLSFQPTPPTRTETKWSNCHSSITSDFNPLRPRGRRLEGLKSLFIPSDISTHSAHEDGDRQPSPPLTQSQDFNPLRPRGRRQQYYTKKPTILHHISTIKSHHTPSNHRQPTLHTSKTVLIVQFFRCESPRKFMFASGSHQTI